MKNSILKIAFVGVVIIVATLQTFAQKVLPEITITAANYKYLNAINPEEAAQPVSMVEHYTATYDIKGAEFYEEENDNYFVSFYIPEGKFSPPIIRKVNLYAPLKIQKCCCAPRSDRRCS